MRSDEDDDREMEWADFLARKEYEQLQNSFKRWKRIPFDLVDEYKRTVFDSVSMRIESKDTYHEVNEGPFWMLGGHKFELGFEF